jgi:flagellar hook-basal body complex protein FliE
VEGIGSKLDSGKLVLSQLQSNAAVTKAAPKEDASGTVGNVLQSFGDVLKDQMKTINNLQSQADSAQQTYAVGGDIELHNVILATEKAEMSLQLAMQVRNKMVAAYQEISHMNV